MNRRGFIGALSGLVAWAKKTFLDSPAASAIPPTCETIGFGVEFEECGRNAITATMEEWTCTGGYQILISRAPEMRVRADQILKVDPDGLYRFRAVNGVVVSDYQMSPELTEAYMKALGHDGLSPS